jgi:hypothetical protein
MREGSGRGRHAQRQRGVVQCKHDSFQVPICQLNISTSRRIVCLPPCPGKQCVRESHGGRRGLKRLGAEGVKKGGVMPPPPHPIALEHHGKNIDKPAFCKLLGRGFNKGVLCPARRSCDGALQFALTTNGTAINSFHCTLHSGDALLGNATCAVVSS